MIETTQSEPMELDANLKNKIVVSIERILKNQFGGRKSECDQKHERLNFACPYCGDGESDNSKRGNLYWNTLKYHCYNGGCPTPHTSLVTFLKDHNEGFTNLEDLNNVLDYIKTNTVAIKSSEYLQTGVFETLNNLSIHKTDLAKALHARPIWTNDSVYKYLQSRLLHRQAHNFLFNQKQNKLYVLNLVNDRVIGFQVRNMNADWRGPKYISYNIQKIYSDVLKNIEPLKEIQNLEKVNTLSLYFGIFECDFSKEFTIFEGPMDKLLYPRNCLAISGAGKNTDMFDDNPHVRYFFDNDSTGKKYMASKLKTNKSVFLWTRFLDKSGIPPRRIKDYNDIIKYCYRNKHKGFKLIEECFSANKFDTYFL